MGYRKHRRGVLLNSEIIGQGGRGAGKMRKTLGRLIHMCSFDKCNSELNLETYYFILPCSPK